MTIIRDGKFTTVVANTITSNNTNITGNLSISGNLTVDGTITGNMVTGVTGNSIFVYQMKDNMFTVPYYFGQPLNINPYVYSMRLSIVFANWYDITITFGADVNDTIQMWISYYDSDGNILHDGMSSAFFPENTNIYTAPITASIAPADTYTYGMILTNLHANKPENAAYWALFARPVSETFGTMDIGQYVHVYQLGATAIPNPG